jgi:isoquinoline 1-oxidoreductase alpha subunit
LVSLKVNGATHEVDVPDGMPLLWVLRDFIGLTGTKFGCGIGQCGACTAHADGNAVRSCVTRVGTVADRGIVTIEGISTTSHGRALQNAWLTLQVPQCGYCQPGQIMSAAALLSQVGNPSDAQIDAAMAGNICRCCTYGRIRNAIKQAAAGQGTGQRT